ncbi:hypothetical protein OIU74_017565 [Salix koriyanagi]|uniref:Uncharacterized protein n=1 Tax=Salix koriyanagi TaxID=2511006 RepID=A0A9Q0WPK1_9ROSI|nr:hypothetical protein OIU74_017565 [Salix koriyanagi]
MAWRGERESAYQDGRLGVKTVRVGVCVKA